MNSEVSICNMALVRLGQSRIASLTQSGLEAELSNLYYETTRDELLASFEWPFALTRKRLSVSADDNLTVYDYMYTLPSDYLRVLTMLSDDDYSEITDVWTIEGNKLLSDKNPGYIKYVKKVTNPVGFPQLFVEALYLRIATKMCIKITQDQSLMNMLYQEYMAAMQSAMGTLGANSTAMAAPTTLWSA